MNSPGNREKILSRLRSIQPTFSDFPPTEVRRHMVPVHDTTPGGLRTRFIAEAEKLSATVQQPASDSEAVTQIMKLISDDKK
ncbi:MAG TPA: hypothetical protein VJZ27_10895, partial [Aggregatilineales bacterium]|nr:hypothetical protein [Aggregatilineales bacterium]